MDIEHQLKCELLTSEIRLPEWFDHPFDKWLASSALQKSIRRGYTETALLMTRSFISHEPDYFWRRINVIALEDIGIANIELVNQVLWVSGKRKWIERVGASALAAYLVRAMCESLKDRNACEIPLAVDRHADYAWHRQHYPQIPHLQLIANLESSDFYERALAIWSLLGTKLYPANHFHSAGIALEAVLEHFDEPIATTIRLAKSKNAYALPVGILALADIKRGEQWIECEAPINPEYSGIYPLCALDQYTRGGKKAIHQWIMTNQPLKSFLREHLPYEEWMRYVCLLLFAVETENVNIRLRYDGWDDPLIKSAEGDLLSESFRGEELLQLIAIIRKEIPSLNTSRRSWLKQRTA